jgi:K319-like protein
MKHPAPVLVLLAGCIIFSMVIFSSCQKTTYTPNPPAPSVNAGRAQSINWPADSVTLSGTASDSASRITAYLWSEVTGPNVPVIASAGSKTTSVTGLTTGVYIFQLMAVDSLGATGVDTVSVTVNRATEGGVYIDTLNTGTTQPYELTFLANANSPAGNPADIELLAEAWTVDGVFVTGRSFFRFDMSKIPAGTIFKSATLYLFSDPAPENGDLIHANYGISNDFYIQRVASNWDLVNTNWNNLPATDSVGEVHIPQTSQPFLDLPNINVTTMANNMMSSGNYGFVMRLNSEVEYNSRIFCSSRASDATKHPYLVVTY